MLNSHADDKCCAKHLSKALASGNLETVSTWICPKCGQEWRPRMVNGEIRHWEPFEYVAVF